jgi:cation:H+ antiporter
MILSILLLILGFVLLIAGAELLVRGASSFARRLNVPDIVIGLTIVAFGTSTPELVVNVMSAVRGAADISFGNIIGSNVFNILFILGVSALVFPLDVKKATTWREIPFALLTSFILLVLVNDAWFIRGAANILTAGDGLILLGFFAIFLVYTHNLSKQGAEEEGTSQIYPMLTSILFILLGLGGLIFGGNIVVKNAVILARLAGISEAVIGLTIVAVGTSLPELATSVVAAIRKKPDIAVGNIVGSNIFNLLFIMGITSLIRPIHYSLYFNPGQYVMIGATFLLFLMMFNPKQHRLDRWEGAVLLLGFIAYSLFVV